MKPQTPLRPIIFYGNPIGPGLESYRSRPLRDCERIDFFLSHSWHDDAVQKWVVLTGGVEDGFYTGPTNCH